MKGRPPVPVQPGGERRAWLLPLAVLVFCAIAYGPALHVPFIGDDYVFLDKTRNASFVSLWSRSNVDFGWYRPWSREFHFWSLQQLFGAREPGFRAFSLALWLFSLWLYHAFTRRSSGQGTAGLAVLGLCSLSLWGAPLTWISGAQDLWMLIFATLTLWLLARGQWPLALASYAGALLSKETAATIPVVVLAFARWIEGRRWRDAVRLALPFGLLTILWVFLHPTLLDRLLHPGVFAIGGERPMPPYRAAALSLLTLANLDKLNAAPDFEALRPIATTISALVLALAAWMPGGNGAVPERPEVSRGNRLRFGTAWCVAGWLPLFQSSIGWHAYYGSLGVFGAWFVIATLLEGRSRRAIVVLIFALGMLRGWAAAARSWDWGSEWYQTRAGSMLSVIRHQLLILHPTLPHRSRLYFGNIPNNIGLIAGRSPAVRVWYDDSTLFAGFYSYYRPRPAGAGNGPDLFFHFDSSSGIREVFLDGGPRAQGRRSDPGWEADHERLAMTLLTQGDLPRAARLFEAVAELPHRPDAAMFAAACWSEYGDSLRASVDLAEAQRRTGLSRVQVLEWEKRLRASMPRR